MQKKKLYPLPSFSVVSDIVGTYRNIISSLMCLPPNKKGTVTEGQD